MMVSPPENWRGGFVLCTVRFAWNVPWGLDCGYAATRRHGHGTHLDVQGTRRSNPSLMNDRALRDRVKDRHVDNVLYPKVMETGQ